MSEKIREDAATLTAEWAFEVQLARSIDQQPIEDASDQLAVAVGVGHHGGLDACGLHRLANFSAQRLVGGVEPTYPVLEAEHGFGEIDHALVLLHRRLTQEQQSTGSTCRNILGSPKLWW